MGQNLIQIRTPEEASETLQLLLADLSEIFAMAKATRIPFHQHARCPQAPKWIQVLRTTLPANMRIMLQHFDEQYLGFSTLKANRPQGIVVDFGNPLIIDAPERHRPVFAREDIDPNVIRVVATNFTLFDADSPHFKAIGIHPVPSQAGFGLAQHIVYDQNGIPNTDPLNTANVWIENWLLSKLEGCIASIKGKRERVFPLNAEDEEVRRLNPEI